MKRLGASVTALANLACQVHGAQVGKEGGTFTQMIEIECELAWPAKAPRAVIRGLRVPCDVFADRLGIAPRPTGYSADFMFCDHGGVLQSADAGRYGTSRGQRYVVGQNTTVRLTRS
jgi:hypothetical protein